MKLAVVVINWNAADDTRRVLQTVASWSSPLFQATTWVVDNASSDPGVDEMELGGSGVHLIRNDANLGFAGANNVAIEAALKDGADAILLLNNDAFVDGPCVEAMLAALESDPSIGVVGPVLWHDERLLSVGGRDIALHGDTHLRSPWPLTKLLDVDYVPGTAALVHRRAFDAVGFFDEEFFFAGEMADFCFRLRGDGLRCVTAPNADAYHDIDRSSRFRETLHPYYVFRNRFLFVAKHHGHRRAVLALTWVVRSGVAIAIALVRRRLPRARAIALGLVDGMRGRFGGRNGRVVG